MLKCDFNKVVLRGETASKTQCHGLLAPPKNWRFERGHSESQNIGVFGRHIGLKLKRLEGFSRKGYEELVIR